MKLLFARTTVVGFGGLLVSLYAIAMVRRIASLDGWLDANHLPFGGDFVTFWAAGRLALEGTPADAFDPTLLYAVEEAAVPGSRAHFLWNYPPMFHLAVLPLAKLPFVTAVFAWWATTLPIYAGGLWALTRRWESVVLGFASSAALLTLAHGQNGFLLVGLAAAGMAAILSKREWMAGALLGCLCLKPHYAVLLPFALAASGRWKAFVATGATATVWAVASTAAFGVSYWAAFLENLPVVKEAIDSGALGGTKLVTPYVFLRQAGLDAGVATAMQSGLLLLGIALTVWAFRREGSRGATWALLWVTTPLMSPYLFDYDLLLWSAAFACAYLDPAPWTDARRSLWALAAVVPLACAPLHAALGFQVGPLFGAVLVASCVHQVLQCGKIPA